MGVKHNFVSAKPDSADATLASSSEWNADHTIDGDVDMASHKIVNLATPSSATDGVTKAYVDAVAASGGGVSGAGTAGKVARFSGASAVGDSTISDDGNRAIFTNINTAEQDLGLLGGGAIDLDLSGYPTKNVFKFTVPVGGSWIRSIKRTIGTTGADETIWLKNMSSNTKPGDNVCAFTQDDGAGAYSQHIHLSCRQPWWVLPALDCVPLRLDATQNKWFLAVPGSFATQPRDIPITFELATGNQNDIAPVDMTTGLDGRFASHWRVIPVAGTILMGIASVVTAGTNWARLLHLTNYGGVSCKIGYNNVDAGSGAGTSTFPLRFAEAATLTWRAWSTLTFRQDNDNSLWLVSGVA